MPLYEFVCEACGQRFEERQSVEERMRQTPPCPRCHSTERVERVLSIFQAQTSRKS